VLFLIALVNGVNLLLVRASARGREISVRLALGASRGRLMRQLLAEGWVLGVLGGFAAVVLAWGLVTAIARILPSEATYFSPHPLEVEGRTLLFVLAASLAVGLLLSLVPAVQLIGRRSMVSVAVGRTADDAPVRRRLRNTLVVTQVAMSMALLAAAGLLARSFVRLLAVDPGFEYERVALADLMASETRYPDGATRAELARRMEDALEARPEIESVSVAGGGGFTSGHGLEAEGAPPPESRPVMVPLANVAPDYFETMGTNLVAGRVFGSADAGSDNVIVDRDFATWLWGAADAVGRRFRLGDDEPWLTVIGVVEELRLMGRDQRRGPYQILYPRPPEPSYGYLEFAMRTSGRPEALLPIFQETLRAIDPEQSYWRLRTASGALAEEEEKPRFLLTLVGLLAAVAVTLAAVGLYGVLAYSVARRARELGIRMALGADRDRVRSMVLKEGLAIAALGVALGTGGALLMVRLIETLLYEVPPRDVATFSITAVALLVVAALASFLPARRATRVDPVEVLRSE
jgi:putative ABC transport system permease protein